MTITDNQKEELQLILQNIDIEPKEYQELRYEIETRESEERNRFSRILLKTSLEEFTDKIYTELSKLRCADVMSVRKSMDDVKKNSIQHCLEVAESLLVLKTGKENIKVSNAKKSVTLNNQGLIGIIERSLVEQYKLFRLNCRLMTFEEGKKELENYNNDPAVKDWIDGYISEYMEMIDLSYEEKMLYSEWSITDIDEDMIEYYISNSLISDNTISTEQIETTINQLKSDKKELTKRGANRRNYKLYAALLIFIDCKCKRSNQSSKIVYSCLDFFGFIDEKLKEQWQKTETKYSEIQYVKSLFKEADKFYISTELPF